MSGCGTCFVCLGQLITYSLWALRKALTQRNDAGQCAWSCSVYNNCIYWSMQAPAFNPDTVHMKPGCLDFNQSHVYLLRTQLLSPAFHLQRYFTWLLVVFQAASRWTGGAFGLCKAARSSQPTTEKDDPAFQSHAWTWWGQSDLYLCC